MQDKERQRRHRGTMALFRILYGAAVVILLSANGCDSTFHDPGQGSMHDGQRGWHWPWKVVISREWGPTCLGSLVDHEWVLTDMSCKVEHGQSAKVHLGPMGGSDPYSCPVTVEVDCSRCHEPPKSCHPHEGLCLLKLSNWVNYTTDISPVSLASPDSVFYSDVDTWVPTGTHPGAMVKHPIVGHKRCKCHHDCVGMYQMCTGWPEQHGKMMNGPMDNTGGPVVVDYNGMLLQVGVVPSGQGHMSPDSPNVFPSVAAYFNWISEITGVHDYSAVSFKSEGPDPDCNYVCPTTPPCKQDRDHDSIFGSSVTMSPTPFVFLCVLVLSLYSTYR